MAVSKESSAVRGTVATSTAVQSTRLQARAGSRLRIRRQFTRPGIHPFDEMIWERRGARIANEKGEIVFEQDDVEVPASQLRHQGVHTARRHTAGWRA